MAELVADVRGLLRPVPTGIWAGGEWASASDGTTFSVRDPADGEVIAHVADATVEDLTIAIAAAHDSLASWSGAPPRERSDILRRAFDTMLLRTDEMALLIVRENGKTMADARGEVAYAAEFLRWFSEEAVRIDGDYRVAPASGTRTVVVRQPVGVSLAITPWNFPAAMITRKLGPAFAAGCPVVLKPAEDTPLTALLLAEIFHGAGLPRGVLSVLPTSRPADLVSAAMADPRLRKVSFTGSTQVGRRLLRQAADQVLVSSMELGGNAPFIVCADADLEAAVDGAMVAKLRNGGEACTAANRFFVETSVAEKFSQLLAERMGAVKVGCGDEAEVGLGPLVNEEAVRKVDQLVRDTISAGARVVLGGVRPQGAGNFYPATVLLDVPRDAPVVTQEIFGPVAPIISFSSDEEVLTMANGTEYGLVAYLFTEDLTRGLRLAEALEVGMVGINRGVVSDPAAPFGGMKQSGLGREGGSQGLDEFLQTKYMSFPL